MARRHETLSEILELREEDEYVLQLVAEVEPDVPEMPPSLWEEVKLLLLVWNRAQQWGAARLTASSVEAYARLVASLYDRRSGPDATAMA